MHGMLAKIRVVAKHGASLMPNALHVVDSTHTGAFDVVLGDELEGDVESVGSIGSVDSTA